MRVTRPPRLATPLILVALSLGMPAQVLSQVKENVPDAPQTTTMPVSVFAVEFSPDGQLMAVLVPSGISIIGVADNKVRTRIRCEFVPRSVSPLSSLAFSPDSKQIAMCQLRYQATSPIGVPQDLRVEFRLYDAHNGQLLREAIEDAVSGVLRMALSSDGALYACATAPPNPGDRFQGRETYLLDVFNKKRTLIHPAARSLSNVAFSASADAMVVGISRRRSNDLSEILIYDTASGDIKRRLELNLDNIRSLAISFQQHLLAVGSPSYGSTPTYGRKDSLLWLYDIERKQKTAAITSKDCQFGTLVFSEDGTRIVGAPPTPLTGGCPPDRTQARTAGRSLLTVWNIQTKTVENTININHPAPTALRWIPNSSRVAFLSLDDTLLFYDANTAQYSGTLTAEVPAGFPVPPSRTGSLERLRAARSELNIAAIRALAFHPDGASVIGVGDADMVYTWEVKTGLFRRGIEAEGEGASAAISPDGKTLAVIRSEDRLVLIKDLKTGGTLHRLDSSADLAGVLAFSPNGKLLASGGAAGTVRIWDAGSGELTATLEGQEGPVRALAFSRNGSTLASAGKDLTVRLWDVIQRKPSYTLTGHAESLRSLAFADDGKTLAGGGDARTVFLWDPANPTPARKLKGHEGPVNSVAFSPDGAMLATGGVDSLRLWDARKMKLIKVLMEYPRPAGPLISTPTDWDPQPLPPGAPGTSPIGAFGRRPPAAFTGDYVGPSWVVSFSPDGKVLATGTANSSVVIWDMTSVSGKKVSARVLSPTSPAAPVR